MKELTPERRRRLIFRALPAVAGLSVLALVGGDDGRAPGPRPPPSGRRATSRWPGSAGTATRCTGCSTRAHRPAGPRTRFAAPTARGRHGHARWRCGPQEPEGERDGAVVGPGGAAHARVRAGSRANARAGRATGGVAWSPRLTFLGPRRGRALSGGGAASPSGRRCWPSTARCWPRGRRTAAAPRSARWPPRSPGHLEPETDADRPRGPLPARLSARLAGGGERPGAGLRAAAGRPARGRAPGRRARCWPAPSRAGRGPSAPRSTPASRRRRWPRWPAGSGGIAAIDPRTGEIRALAGIAFSAPQPPGSTFKIVTATAALEAGAVKLSTPFPVESAAVIDGVPLENANGEFCGGTFRSSFAHSCNSVFAPLGVKLGASRLVNAALRYGWNSAPSVPGEAPSTLPRQARSAPRSRSAPPRSDRGRCWPPRSGWPPWPRWWRRAGVRLEPSLEAGRPPETVRVTSRKVARTLSRLMRDVVVYGTGTAAALPGVKVAGKTGTAELEDTRGPDAARRTAARRLEHRRLVRGLRAGQATADRGGRAARPRRRGRGHGGAGGAAGAGEGARRGERARGAGAQPDRRSGEHRPESP